MLAPETQFNALLTHYKDTHSIIVQEKQIRERSLLAAIIAITIHCFSIFNEALIAATTNLFIQAKFGIKLRVNFNVINCLVWVILFISLLRYFQANVYINRLYKYMHQLEDKFSALCGSDIIDREGKHYFAHYPLYLHWVRIIYYWFAPALLLIIPSLKICSEFVHTNVGNFALYFDLIIYTCIFISAILYLRFLYAKRFWFEISLKKMNLDLTGNFTR